MTTNIAEKYDLRVPRYTSYPTAPHFSDAVTGDTYAQWLEQLDPKTRLSLYIHIPFCDSMCWFCGCYTKIVKQYKPVMDYLNTALDEVDLVADKLPARFSAQHLHFGGGSPTMLKAEDFAKTIGRVKARFDLDENSEIAVELDPRTATEEYVAELAKAGVNRASIGVQDFDAEVQEAINRIQPFDVTKRVVDWLRKYGINKINMDLLYGLPHQNMDRVMSMVDRGVSMQPSRIALFGYAHVPWMKSHMKMIKEEDLPGSEERWEQVEAASARLIELGYKQIGLDHFAHPDDELSQALDANKLHRNFQGYTTDQANVMIGFGASAIGCVPQGYVQNLLPLKDYTKCIEEGVLPTGKGLAYKGDDILRGEIIERLMCDLEVDVGAVCAEHNADPAPYRAELGKLDNLVEDGLAVINGNSIAMTEKGRYLVRIAAAAFDTYLDQGQKRHSRAV
ncbi:MAG: oxygen-independent coproporphyrinogen III oxidase [Alphaproteobacteria bacterium]|nr:oxygen-independent coproporphyrinogen III oxidase [Alphaproteobacteria bacterium]